VLVNKSQNKTPYELFNGRTPAIGFLRPFSCHVIILNTLDNLGKFEPKGDEGYFIGYSMSSKAFRMFNKRSRRVEENLHVEFLENKAIEKGAGPNWLFDIDSLTKSMNYVPVDAENWKTSSWPLIFSGLVEVEERVYPADKRVECTCDGVGDNGGKKCTYQQVSKILPKIDKTVNEQLEAKVLTRSSNSSKASYVVAADLSELELKKIIIEHIWRYSYVERRRDDTDKDEEPSAGSDRGSKRIREGKEPESTIAPKEKASKTTGKSIEGSKSHQKTASESALAEEPMQTTQYLEEPSHQEFETGVADYQPIVEASQHPECDMAKQADSRTSFNELMDTLVDFLAFLMNQLKVDTLTPELLAGPTYELMKGSCKSLQYPHNLLKPLPLITNSRGHHVIPFDHFINNDLEYLRGGASSRKYTTFVTKIKAADYGHIKWIEDLVPHTMWSQALVSYDKYALWGISHWGRKRQHFYGFTVNRESAQDVYSKHRIIAVIKLQIVEWHDYKHMDWITVRRDDDKLYKFKEGDFKRIRIQYIEDMLLLLGIRMKYLPQIIWRRSDKERAAAMIQAIDKQQKMKRIMRSLEKFVGGRLKIHTLAGNPVKEILLKLNLPNHKSILIDLQVTPTKHGRTTKPYSSYRFIANCLNAGYLKMEVNVPVSSCLEDS
nr:ribonuclease H-like domain-containing protein [Tanacetum cinerariifolium]